jgi:hypothetical protein
MGVDVDSLLASSNEVFLEETEWLRDASPEDLESVYAQFSDHFYRWLATLVQKLGAPGVTRSSHPELASDLYCEAFELAAWPRGAGYLVLACGQHDRETPVFVSFGYREADAA